MAGKLDPKEIVTFKELLIANSIETEALTQLLVEKGLLTFEEIFKKLKEAAGYLYDHRKVNNRPVSNMNSGLNKASM